MELFRVLHESVYDFILIFARLSAMVAFAPIFGAKNIPNYMKALIAFVFAIVFTGFIKPVGVTPETTGAGLIMQLAAEATIGAVIGFCATIIFEIIIFAGYIIDYMIGFGFINIVDPQSGSSISIFAFFYSFLTLLLFLTADAHHILLEIMVRSYELIPVFGGGISQFTMERLMALVSSIFYVGFQIAAPIFVTMFTVDFTLGMLSKTVPQLQIIVVGFPVKISLGLLGLGIILKPTVGFIMGLLAAYRENLLWLVKYFGGGP